MSWTDNTKSLGSRINLTSYRWKMRSKFRRKATPDKAAPLNSPSSSGQVVSRVGNSGSTQSPANSISK